MILEGAVVDNGKVFEVEGAPKPGLGAGLHGVGPPFFAEVRARGRGFRGGGGLCSFGRWPPWRCNRFQRRSRSRLTRFWTRRFLITGKISNWSALRLARGSRLIHFVVSTVGHAWLCRCC